MMQYIERKRPSESPLKTVSKQFNNDYTAIISHERSFVNAL